MYENYDCKSSAMSYPFLVSYEIIKNNYMDINFSHL